MILEVSLLKDYQSFTNKGGKKKITSPNGNLIVKLTIDHEFMSGSHIL